MHFAKGCLDWTTCCQLMGRIKPPKVKLLTGEQKVAELHGQNAFTSALAQGAWRGSLARLEQTSI